MTALDFIGTVVITAVMVVNINAVVSNLTVPRAQKLILTSAIGLWIGFAAASSSMGWMTIAQPVPVIGLFFAAPLLAGLAMLGLPSARAAMLALPMALLIGLNASRVFGGLFLLLAQEGRLSGPFPVSAGWGDVITGVTAIPLLWLLIRKPEQGWRWAVAWNVFGAADLIAAVFLGVTSADGSAAQIFHVGAGSAAMQVLPWSFVPTVLVPFYLILHVILALQLRRIAVHSAIPAIRNA